VKRLPTENGDLAMGVRIADPHPRVGEAMRIVAQILLRVSREKPLETVSSLSPHVAPRRPDAASEN